jgi:hypothetical protein
MRETADAAWKVADLRYHRCLDRPCDHGHCRYGRYQYCCSRGALAPFPDISRSLAPSPDISLNAVAAVAALFVSLKCFVKVLKATLGPRLIAGSQNRDSWRCLVGCRPSLSSLSWRRPPLSSSPLLFVSLLQAPYSLSSPAPCCCCPFSISKRLFVSYFQLFLD